MNETTKSEDRVSPAQRAFYGAGKIRFFIAEEYADISKWARVLKRAFVLYSPATLERVAVEAGAGEVVEDRARLLEFQIGP